MSDSFLDLRLARFTLNAFSVKCSFPSVNRYFCLLQHVFTFGMVLFVGGSYHMPSIIQTGNFEYDPCNFCITVVSRNHGQLAVAFGNLPILYFVLGLGTATLAHGFTPEEINTVTTNSILENPTVLRILFHPRRELQFETTKDANIVHFSVGPGVQLGGRLHTAAADAPVILFWHGNGEIAADYDDIARIYTGMGINFLVVDYRGYGISDGIPTGTALLEDAVTVYGQIQNVLNVHGIRTDRLYIMGRSLGSAAAIATANHAQDSIAGLIVESGFAFTMPLIERLGGLALDGVNESQGFGNNGKIAHVAVPTLIIHGEEDQIIPVFDGRALFEQSGTRKKKLVTIPHAGHNDLMIVGQATYFESIRTFVFGNY